MSFLQASVAAAMPAGEVVAALGGARARQLAAGGLHSQGGDAAAVAVQQYLAHGLSSAEAASRLATAGRNELASPERESLCEKVTEKAREPMILLLLASAGISLLTRQIDDAISITMAVVIVMSVAIYQEYKSDDALSALVALAPHTANVVRDGRTLATPAAEVVPGDVVLFATGDRVPADVRILEAAGLSIDESSLTGENEPCVKTHTHSAAHAAADASAKGVPVAERTCIAHMGSLVRSGRGRGVAIATGAGTELGGVCTLMHTEEARKSPLQTRMDELSKTLTYISFAIIGCIVAVGLLYAKPVLELFTMCVSLAVAAIPEGLPIVVTVTLALGVQRMAASKAVVKTLPAVEALGCASVICVDKTGTLTRNEMTAAEAFTFVAPHSGAAGASRDRGAAQGTPADATSGAATVTAAIPGGLSASAAHHLLHDELGRSIGSRILFTGLGYDAAGGVLKYAPVRDAVRGDDLGPAGTCTLSAATHAHLGVMLEVGAVCNDAQVSRDPETGVVVLNGQPTEGALLVAAAKGGLDGIREAYTRTHEVPFTSETKWMAVRARAGVHTPNTAQAATTGYVPREMYFVKGSVDAVLALCDYAIAPLGTTGCRPAAASATLLGDALASRLARDGLIDFSIAPLSVLQQAAILAAAETLAREGLRVLALAKGDRIPAASRFSGPANPRPLPSPKLDGNGMLVSTHHAASGPDASASDAALVGGLVFVGLIGLHDPPREGVIDSIRTLRRGGVRVCMITGDSEATALAIGAHLGLVDEFGQATGVEGDTSSEAGTPTGGSAPRRGSAPFGSDARAPTLQGGAHAQADVGADHEVDTEALALAGAAISGTDVDALTEEELSKRVSSVSVFFRTTPHHKMKIVRAFQRLGLVVAMTGDGVNDAPALKVADIGVAMGRSGTDVAKEAADMVLLDDNFTTILRAIEEGKGIFYNIRNFVRFQLSTSVAALTLVAASTLMGLPNPLNAMQILWINIIMDGPPAQSLGVETVDQDVMRRPPRKSDEPIITRDLLIRVFSSAFLIVCGTLAVFYSEMAHDFSATRRDTTMTFTTFVMFDMFNALTCRSADKSIFALGLTTNRFFLLSVGGSLLGQLAVVYAPPLQSVFQTEALSAWDWVFIVSLTSSVLWLDELRKCLCARRSSRRRARSRDMLPCVRACVGTRGRHLLYGYSLTAGGAHKRLDAPASTA